MLAATLGICLLSQSQEPQELAAKHLEPHVTRFTVDRGKLVGPGAVVLRDGAWGHRAVVLGEYHGSQRISEFTAALIPELDRAGFRNFALEVGPTSAQILARLAGDGKQTVRRLGEFNSKYEVRRQNGSTSGPIPFFNDVADAEFLAAAASRKWKFFGIDQEFAFGYLPVYDEMISRWPRLRRDDSPQRSDVREEIIAANELYARDGTRTSTTLRKAKAFNEFLERSERVGFKSVVEDLRESIAIYELNAANDWWQSNSRRIAHMKKNLARGMEQLNFNLEKGRLFVKIGSVHAGRGFTLLRHYEVGNTISELAEAAGGQSLHIAVYDRYRKEGDRIVDGLETDKRYEVFRQFGREVDWTLIDLRPLKRQAYYDGFKMERFVGELMLGFDMVLISPVDEDPVPNR